MEFLDIETLGSNAMALVVAYVLSLPIAWDREQEARSAGLRTFPLVAVAAAAFMMVARTLWPGEADAQARVLQGLITGVGFVGGGAILKGRGRVSGTATATSIWATGALGAAVAYGLYGMALLLSAATFATLRWLTPLKEQANGDGD